MISLTSATFLLMLLFINFLFGYQLFLDLSRGYVLTHGKLLAIIATSAVIVLGALAIIAYQLLKHGYSLRDMKRIHIILKEKDLKGQRDSLAKLRWEFVDQVLWTIIAANAAILFVAHYILVSADLVNVAAVFAIMISGVMLYAPLAFLILYPIGRLLEKDFPFNSPVFFLSFGLLCLILSLASYQKLNVWWDPLLVGVSWIATGFINIKRGRLIDLLSFTVLLLPLILTSLECPAAILPALAVKGCSVQLLPTLSAKIAILFSTTFLVIIAVLRIFGYGLTLESFKELSEGRKKAVETGSYNPLKDPVIWIIWIVLISCGVLIALLWTEGR